MSDTSDTSNTSNTHDSADPITDYLTRLARHLTTDDQRREAILAEVRAHLEEAEAHASAAGADPHAAAQHAITAFGSVTTVAQRFNAVHPISWSPARLLRGVAWGVVVTWLV